MSETKPTAAELRDAFEMHWSPSKGSGPLHVSFVVDLIDLLAAKRNEALEEAATVVDCTHVPKCLNCTSQDRAIAIRALKGAKR